LANDPDLARREITLAEGGGGVGGGGGGGGGGPGAAGGAGAGVSKGGARNNDIAR
jgi:hypothetical protein